MTELFAVTVGEVAFGLPLEAVKEVIRLPATEPAIGAPPWVRGVARYRGVAIPVIDLKTRFRASGSPGNRAVLCAVGGRMFALDVDGTGGIVRVEDAEVASAGRLSPAARGIAPWLSPAGARRLICLDLESLLSSAEQPSWEEFRVV